MTRHQIGGRVSRGLLLPIHRTVFALGVRRSTLEARAMAGVLACGAGAVASHGTAAALHGMLNARGGPVHVTTPPPTRRLPDVSSHVSRSGGARSTTVAGVPCTGPPRTVVDLASADGTAAASRASSTLAGRRALRPRAVERELRAFPHRRGTAAVLALLEEHRVAVTGRTRSQLEEAALRLCAHHRLPTPSVNQLVELPEGTYEADLLWAEARLIVELDGWATHGHTDGFRKDRRRDFDFELAGWSTVRLLWSDVTADAEATADRLRRRLTRGR